MGGIGSFVIFAVATLVAAGAALAETPRLLGAQSCASAACHDAREAQPNASVAQNEFRRWSTADPHRLAFESLRGPRAAAIVQNAKLGAAPTLPLCLGCHTAAQPGAVAGERFTQTEGVSCESCHGPAASWIGPHARGLYHYDEVLAAGLYPTANVEARARQCLRCHGPAAGVDHTLIAAGHPRPKFDLASFSRLQPGHFVVDADYRQRKRPTSEAATWAVGASMMLATRFKALGDPLRGWSGAFPDASLLNCDGCHVAVTERSRTGGAAHGSWAQQVADLSELPALLAIADAVAPDVAGEVRARVQALDAAGQSRTAFSVAAAALSESFDRLGGAIARADVRGAKALQALRALVGPDVGAARRLEAQSTSFAVRALAREAIASGAAAWPDAQRTLAQMDASQSADHALDFPSTDMRAALRREIRPEPTQ